MPHCEMNKIIRDLKRAGYQITKTKGQHWLIKDAEGRFVTITASTSRSVRGQMNLRATIKRHERQHPQLERKP